MTEYRSVFAKTGERMGRGRSERLKRGRRKLLGVMDMFIILIVVMI